MQRRILMYGAADQARVNEPILRDFGCEIALLADDTPGKTSPFAGVPLVGGLAGVEEWIADEDPSSLGFVIAIANPYAHVRLRLHDRLVALGLTPISFADRTALVRSSVCFGPGLQVMPGAVIHNEARLGTQVMVNTRALVEHDCVLEDGAEIGPGAVLTGRVHVGRNTWIGAGAVIRPRITIGANTIVGAGAVVVSDIPPGIVAVGVPARPMAGRTTPSAEAL